MNPKRLNAANSLKYAFHADRCAFLYHYAVNDPESHQGYVVMIINSQGY